MSGSRDPLVKVTAFITRGAGAEAELLLFRHPVAGVQVPAGTVEVGEEAAAAARREAHEETGLRAFESCVRVGERVSEFRAECGAMLRESWLHASSALDHRTSSHLRRGLPVRIHDRTQGARLVSLLQHDHSYEPPVQIETERGWVSTDCVATLVCREYFHLRHHAPTPARWAHQADGHELALFWTRLVPSPSLVGPQQPWMDDVHGLLVRQVSS